MESFGEQLRAYRERLGMSQQTLAERTGVSPSQLSRIQSGEKKPPPAETVLRMIEVLRLTADEAANLLEAANYSPQLLESSTIIGTVPLAARQQLVRSLERAATDLESASHELRKVIDVLSRIVPPETDQSE